MPNGHHRASTLMIGEPGIPRSEALAEQAKVLWDNELAGEQIAAQLGCSLQMALEALDHWFRAREHTPPNYAERRLALMDRLVAWYDQDLPLNEIAAKVGLNSLTVRRLLHERLEQLGREMMDGRSRPTKKG